MQRRMIHLFRIAASRFRVRGMHRLACALYDPFERESDYIAGVVPYGGGVIHVDTRSYIEWWIYMYGSFEGAAVDLLASVLRPTSVVVDVGANVGVFTLPFARIAREVHAFEPNPSVRMRLEQNLSLNNLHNVVVNETALADAVGIAQLHAPTHANQGQSSLHPRDDLDQSVDCRVTTLDRYVEDVGLRSIDLIKVDVEGAEPLVLQGAIETLRRYKPLVYVEINAQHLGRGDSTPGDVQRFLEDLGYQVWLNHSIERRARSSQLPLTALRDTAFESTSDTYWLAVHPEACHVRTQ